MTVCSFRNKGPLSLPNGSPLAEEALWSGPHGTDKIKLALQGLNVWECSNCHINPLLASYPSVRPSVRMYQRGSHWTDFREIWYWVILWKISNWIQNFVKMWGGGTDHRGFVGHFTLTPKYVLLLPAALDGRGIRLVWGTNFMGTRRNTATYVIWRYCLVCSFLLYGSRTSGCQPGHRMLSFVSVTNWHAQRSNGSSWNSQLKCAV
jgi:hypothetical protein